MKLKELSLTDLIALISTISVLVSVTSQAYFYYRLDALWVMSLLTPSIYFVEVVKVIILFILLFSNILIVELLFKKIIKYILGKKKVKLLNNKADVQELLSRQQKKYGNNLTLFFIVILFFEAGILKFLGIEIYTAVFFWIAFVSGLFLGLLDNKGFDRATKRFTLVLILFFITALNAELKIVELDRAPYIYLKNDNDEKYRLVEVTQDKVIIFKVVDSNYQIQLMNTDQIKKIVAEVSPNQ